jgi:hypothetical protein
MHADCLYAITCYMSAIAQAVGLQPLHMHPMLDNSVPGLLLGRPSNHRHPMGACCGAVTLGMRKAEVQFV